MIVDTHFHVWDAALGTHGWLDNVPSLDRRYTLAQYERTARESGVSRSVLVQVIHDVTETAHFLELAHDSELVGGVVGWIDLEAPDVSETLASLRASPYGRYLVGLRHLVEGEVEPAFLERDTVQRGLAAIAASGLTFDLLVRPQQLASALRAVRACEGLTVVLDHAGFPNYDDLDENGWRTNVAELARTGRAACKLSGFVTELKSREQRENLRNVVSFLIDTFTTRSLLFGSDWPICLQAATFKDVLLLVQDSLSELTSWELDDVLGGNALRWYCIDEVNLDGRDSVMP
ncbi:MAG: amidohydrolase family protein [Acidimicrobiales bacterium]